MNKKGLVSFLGTSYNNSSLEITRCLNSLINQTYKKIEIIIVIEPGSENTHVFKLYEKRFQKIKIIVNKKKLGFVRSLNVGLKYCCGEYIKRFDFDDYYHLSKVAKQVKFLKKNLEISVCGTNTKNFNRNNFIKKKFPKTNLFIKFYFYFFNSIAHSSALFRSSLIKKNGNYNEKFKYAEDLELWLRYQSNDEKFHNLQDFLTFYNVENKKYVRKKENFIYNLKARKEHSQKLFGHFFGTVNILIFYLFLFFFKPLSMLLNKYYDFKK